MKIRGIQPNTTKQILFILFCFTFLFLVQGCFLIPEEQQTMVQGKVSNQITGEAIANLPIQVWECESGLLYFSGTPCYTLPTQLTDNEGNYQISFSDKKKHFYKVGIGLNAKYESTANHQDGFRIEVGKANTVNFQTNPYTIVKVNLKVTRNAKDRFTLVFHSDDSKGNSLGGTIWNDETKRFYQIDTTFYQPVLPLRNYRFDVAVCDKIAAYDYQNCELISLPNLYVNYVDTTTYQIEIK
jgi:hypothetical protein